MSLPAARSITLTTPSLGVRQWRDDGDRSHTSIAWATTGGRGLPRSVILLPVERVDDRWRPAATLLADLAARLREFRHLVRNVDEVLPESREDPTAPRRIQVRNDHGREWGSTDVLVLLVFDEPRVVGDQDDLAQGGVGFDADDAVAHRQEITAIHEFFGPERYDERLVARGLVPLPVLDAGDPPGTLVFALASCQQPADILDGAGRNPDPPASASLLRLSRLLASERAPSLLVLTGDQVYVDATAGLFDARAKTDRLRLPYQNLMASPGAQAVFGLLPVAMLIDDHEIVDNWEPGVPLPPPTGMCDAMNAYRRFQRMAGPPPPPASPRALWCEFEYSGVPFFLADTRTQRHTADRTPRGVSNWRQARIMDDEQWKALECFLRRNKQRVAFVVSPSMLLPRNLGLHDEPSLALEADDWDGYPASRDALLALLCELNAQRVIFLSGDAHTSCVAAATVTRGKNEARLWSVHSSGLYCPYPFANGSAADYAAAEAFTFPEDAPAHARFRCVVDEPIWAPGDGFATLALTHVAPHSARLEVRFHRAARSPKPVVPPIPV